MTTTCTALDALNSSNPNPTNEILDPHLLVAALINQGMTEQEVVGCQTALVQQRFLDNHRATRYGMKLPRFRLTPLGMKWGFVEKFGEDEYEVLASRVRTALRSNAIAHREASAVPLQPAAASINMDFGLFLQIIFAEHLEGVLEP